MKKPTTKKKPTGIVRNTARGDRVIIGISLPADVVERMDAFGADVASETGIDPTRRGTLGAMLIRKGLAAWENERKARTGTGG